MLLSIEGFAFRNMTGSDSVADFPLKIGIRLNRSLIIGLFLLFTPLYSSSKVHGVN